jgi:O-antigen/teichoic acid export membrane protein
LRVLLLGAQLLTTFLMTLPFSSGFRQIVQSEKWVYLATFFCAVISLILFTAPAVQHRAIRPLLNRPGFKKLASRQMLMGAAALSCALVLGVELVTAEVFGHLLGVALSILTAVLIGLLWWVWPQSMKKRFSLPDSSASREIQK